MLSTEQRLSLATALLYNPAPQVHAMDILEVLEQVRELLQQKGRVSYRILKLQFQLDEDQLEGLKDEFIEAERVAVDEFVFDTADLKDAKALLAQLA